MKEYGLVRNPKIPKVNKKLLPGYPKRVKHPKYFHQKMRQIRKGML